MLDELARHFGVLSEPARLRILHVLGGRERCVTDILGQAGLSQANASRHLGLMYRAGMLARRRDGAQVFYRVSDSLCLDVCRVIGAQVDGTAVDTGAGDHGVRLTNYRVFQRPADEAGADPTPPVNEKEEASG